MLSVATPLIAREPLKQNTGDRGFVRIQDRLESRAGFPSAAERDEIVRRRQGRLSESGDLTFLAEQSDDDLQCGLSVYSFSLWAS